MKQLSLKLILCLSLIIPVQSQFPTPGELFFGVGETADKVNTFFTGVSFVSLAFLAVYIYVTREDKNNLKACKACNGKGFISSDDTHDVKEEKQS